MTKGIFIGELARLTGTNTNTIRYYESQGLMLTAQRSESGYRVYSDEDAMRINFIQKAKLIGLSLTEIRDILDHRAKGSSPCAQVASYLDCKVADVDQRVRDLLAFREELVTLRARMRPDGDSPEGVICGFIEGLPRQEQEK